MANPAFPFTPERIPAQQADDAWQAELVRVFGKDAGTARYQDRGKGEPSSILRKLHDDVVTTRDAWHASREG